MNLKYLNVLIIVIFFILLPLTSFKGSEVEQTTPKVKWYSIEEAQALTKENPKKIYIDMYTDWCGWCKVMDNKTFTDARIIEQLNSNFYPVKFDAEGKNDVVFRDQTFKYVAQGNRGYHQLAAAMMNGKLSYPTSIFLDENLNIISPLPGYMTPDKLEPILDYIGNDHYKTTPFDKYIENKN